MDENYVPDISFDGLVIGNTKLYGIGHHKQTKDLMILFADGTTWKANEVQPHPGAEGE